MSEKYELSEFQKELEKAEHLFSMYWTRKELKNRLDKIEQKDVYINSLLQYTNDLESALQQKDNIIKEVMEYIESNPLVYIGDTDVKVEDILYQEKNIEDTKFFKTLFEILDKENK